MANYSVFGMGNPLMDLIGRVPAERLARIGAAPGTMSLVDAERAAQVAGGLRRHERRPGGSCAWPRDACARRRSTARRPTRGCCSPTAWASAGRR